MDKLVNWTMCAQIKAVKKSIKLDNQIFEIKIQFQINVSIKLRDKDHSSKAFLQFLVHLELFHQAANLSELCDGVISLPAMLNHNQLFGGMADQ